MMTPAVPDGNNQEEMAASKLAGTTKLFRAMRHVGQLGVKYMFSILVSEVSIRVPVDRTVTVEYVRGLKRARSKEHVRLLKSTGITEFVEPLRMMSTLFTSKDGMSPFAPKEAKIQVIPVMAKRFERSIGDAVFDLAQMLNPEYPDEPRSALIPLARCQDSKGYMRIIVSATRLSEAPAAVAERGVRRQRSSRSVGGLSAPSSVDASASIHQTPSFGPVTSQSAVLGGLGFDVSPRSELQAERRDTLVERIVALETSLMQKESEIVSKSQEHRKQVEDYEERISSMMRKESELIVKHTDELEKRNERVNVLLTQLEDMHDQLAAYQRQLQTVESVPDEPQARSPGASLSRTSGDTSPMSPSAKVETALRSEIAILTRQLKESKTDLDAYHQALDSQRSTVGSRLRAVDHQMREERKNFALVKSNLEAKLQALTEKVQQGHHSDASEIAKKYTRLKDEYRVVTSHTAESQVILESERQKHNTERSLLRQRIMELEDEVCKMPRPSMRSRVVLSSSPEGPGLKGRLLELEEELISTKLKLAESETSKDKEVLRLRKKLTAVWAKLKEYSTDVTDLEIAVSDLKMQLRTKKRSFRLPSISRSRSINVEREISEVEIERKPKPKINLPTPPTTRR